jgi:hypothetical protein
VARQYDSQPMSRLSKSNSDTHAMRDRSLVTLGSRHDEDDAATKPSLDGVTLIGTAPLRRSEEMQRCMTQSF